MLPHHSLPIKTVKSVCESFNFAKTRSEGFRGRGFYSRSKSNAPSVLAKLKPSNTATAAFFAAENAKRPQALVKQECFVDWISYFGTTFNETRGNVALSRPTSNSHSLQRLLPAPIDRVTRLNEAVVLGLCVQALHAALGAARRCRCSHLSSCQQ